MRLRERDKRQIVIMPPDNENNDNRTYKWKNDGMAIDAIVRPMSNELVAKVYGQNHAIMMELLYDGDETLKVGMGVHVELKIDPPDLNLRMDDGNLYQTITSENQHNAYRIHEGGDLILEFFGSCDFRIVDIKEWDCTRCVLEFIPEDRRE